MIESMIGKLISCSRCGTAAFLAYEGTEALDGGYTKYDKFEPVPKNWISTSQFGYLCPSCAKLFQDKLTTFLGHTNFAPVFKVEEDANWEPRNLVVYMRKEEIESVEGRDHL